MRNRGVIPATCARMHNVLNPGLFRVVEQRFALPEHIDRVAGHKKKTVNALECRQVRAFVIRIEDDRRIALGRKGCGFLLGTNGGHGLDRFIR